jgi:hypothetical protein
VDAIVPSECLKVKFWIRLQSANVCVGICRKYQHDGHCTMTILYQTAGCDPLEWPAIFDHLIGQAWSPRGRRVDSYLRTARLVFCLQCGNPTELSWLVRGHGSCIYQTIGKNERYEDIAVCLEGDTIGRATRWLGHGRNDRGPW